MKVTLAILFAITITSSYSQNKITITGDVKDAKTNEPLAYATIGVTGLIEQTVSDAEGKFDLTIPSTGRSDTLFVTYIGYDKFLKPIRNVSSPEHILLKEYAIVLEEVQIVRDQLDLREVDRNVRMIRGNFYAMSSEVTNLEYNHFLSWLSDSKPELRQQCDFNLSDYGRSVREFYERYHKPVDTKYDKKRSKKDSVVSYNRYPAVNISYEGAVEYCKWLTDRYNENPKKKKFKKVLFRLPTLNEWQIAALGYEKFQSWNLLDNNVEVIIAKDSTSMAPTKGERKTIKVDENIWYPWYWVYVYRNRPYNNFGCYLGNFKIEPGVGKKCPSNAPAYDGFTMMAFVESYFPNNIGLFDVCGNVAEMISEKGKACGGSWDDVPEKSTIQSIKNYKGPDETVGFRVFMEVVER
jgi:formylglycine-generating enzyme required for sulfatase activity